MSGNRGPTTLVLAVAPAMAMSVTGAGRPSPTPAGTADAGQPVKHAVTAAAALRAVGVPGRAIPAEGWDRPADQDARVHAAGLDLPAAENLTVHYHSDPAGLVRPHQEVAVVVTTGGRTTTVPPSSYAFPAGL